MRVLITGGSGFVGRHLQAYIAQKTDWEVVDYKPNLKHYIPDNGDFDYIINLASNSSVEKSIADPVPFVKNNVTLELNVLEYARLHPPKVFLQFSSIEAKNITNPYAGSKAAQEAIATAYWRTYGVPVVIVRSSNIIGEGQSAEKFIPTLVRKIKANEPVSIYTNKGAIGSRYYNPVTNICDAILYILQHRTPTTNADRPLQYDLFGGEELTNLEMAQLVARLLGKDLKAEFIEADTVRPGYDQRIIPSYDALKPVDWRPPQTLEEGLAWIK